MSQTQHSGGWLFQSFLTPADFGRSAVVLQSMPDFNNKSDMEERNLKNYTDSDYALNKYSEGIVYKFADGVVEITLEDYLLDNPDKTTEDFAELKALSDEIYHEQVIQMNRTSRLNVSIDGMEGQESLSVPAVDTQLIRQQEETLALEAARQLLDSGKLTEIQKRRFLLYYMEGLSTRQIAAVEGVHQRAVWDSLMWIGKKLKKFYSE